MSRAFYLGGVMIVNLRLRSMDFRIPLVIQGLLICFCLPREANFIGACLLTILN